MNQAFDDSRRWASAFGNEADIRSVYLIMKVCHLVSLRVLSPDLTHSLNMSTLAASPPSFENSSRPVRMVP
jgi:hypothetical protein